MLGIQMVTMTMDPTPLGRIGNVEAVDLFNQPNRQLLSVLDFKSLARGFGKSFVEAESPFFMVVSQFAFELLKFIRRKKSKLRHYPRSDTIDNWHSAMVCSR